MRTNVAVLRGGPSPLYDASLKSGSAVLRLLAEERYNVKDILIDKEGVWHSRGLPVSPHRALQDIDVAFIALHGAYGEDGTVQRVLDAHNVPYTGSKVFGSTIAVDKGRTKQHIGALSGVKVPGYRVLHRESTDTVRESQTIFQQFGPPYIVKPLKGGASLGIVIAQNSQELATVLSYVFEYSDSVIVEQYIRGKEATCSVVEHFRNQRYYSLPPVEISVPKDKKWYDYDAKCDDTLEHACPGNFTADEKRRIQDAARLIHQNLNLSGYSRSDFIVATSGVYFLEVNTHPDLYEASLLPKSLDAVGVSLSTFLEHLVRLAQNKHERYD